MNKYFAKLTEYNGVKYHSKLEACYAAELDMRVKARDIRSWQRQLKIPLEAYGELICNYVIDFEIRHNDNSLEYVEVKGRELPEWKIKWKMLKAKLKKEKSKTRLTIIRREDVNCG